MHYFHTKVCTVKYVTQVGTTLPEVSTTDWLKLKPFKLKAMVQMPIDVNQTQITGHEAKKK